MQNEKSNTNKLEEKETILQVKNLEKSYIQGRNKLNIFKDVNLTIKAKEMIALKGPSGSGKTSLLNIIGLLDTPSKGEVLFKGRDVLALKENQREKIRGRDIGFIFQFHHLLPDFSAVENIMIPQLIQGVDKKQAKEVARGLLKSMNLGARENHFPTMLSGGEQQRIAIARAIAFKPALIIADEPTGNLDMETAKEVFDLLIETIKNHDVSILIATHSEEIYNKIPRKIQIENKTLVERV